MVVTNQLSSILHSKRARETEANRREERTMRLIAEALGGAGDSLVQGKMLQEEREREDRIIQMKREEAAEARAADVQKEKTKQTFDLMREVIKQQGESGKRLESLREKVAEKGGEWSPSSSAEDLLGQLTSIAKEEKFRERREEAAELGQKVTKSKREGEKHKAEIARKRTLTPGTPEYEEGFERKLQLMRERERLDLTTATILLGIKEKSNLSALRALSGMTSIMTDPALRSLAREKILPILESQDEDAAGVAVNELLKGLARQAFEQGDLDTANLIKNHVKGQ